MGNTTKRIVVIFSRVKDHLKENCDENDTYLNFFKENGMESYTIYLMESQTCQLNLLQEVLLRKMDKYQGIIVTSKKALSAIKQCLKTNNQLSQEGKSALKTNLARIPLYVVAESSRKDAISIGFQNVLGSKSGTAEKLALEIIQDYKTKSDEKLLQEGEEYLDNDNTSMTQKEFLFLTGDKTREILPKLLQQNHINCKELQVYATQLVNKDSSLNLESEELFLKLKLDIQKNYDHQHQVSMSKEMDIWLVHFSPSLVHAFHSSYSHMIPFFKHAAIGPTTLKKLKDLNIPIGCCASLPSSESLLESILDHYQT